MSSPPNGPPADSQLPPPRPESLPEPPRHLWKKRVALSLGTLLFLWLLLELAAWILAPNPAPFHLRDGIYCNSLPLVTGHSAFGVPVLTTDKRLPEQKRPNEFRIAVFGESSIEGQPLDLHASPPTMLYDQLHAAFPDRNFTVINMGKTGSISANVFYYLLYSRRFEPDAIVFYFGANDSPDLGGEECWAAEHPSLHGLWRASVSVSPLLRSIRVYLPQLLWAGQSGSSGMAGGCSHNSFPLWADLLVEFATEIAPIVLVTTPVNSILKALEKEGRTVQEALQTPVYRETLRCHLDPACDQVRHFKSFVTEPAALEALMGSGSSYASWLWTLNSKSSAWRDACQRHGATFIDFWSSLRSLSPDGFIGLSRDMFADEVHLTMRGYMYLARHWVEALRPHLSDQPAQLPTYPAPLEVARYAHAVQSPGYSSLMNFFRRGWVLTTIDGFDMLAAYFVGGKRKSLALLVSAWVRLQVGLPHSLPSDLVPWLNGFEPTALTEDRWNDEAFGEPRRVREAP